MPIFIRSKIPIGVLDSTALNVLDVLYESVCDLREAEVRPEGPLHPSDMAMQLCQAFLWRIAELAAATAALVHQGQWMPAMIMARSLIETVAAFNHAAAALDEVVGGGDLAAIDQLIRTRAFATRLPGLIERAADEPVQATNILTQVRSLRRKVDDIEDDYNHLSEYAHPNGLGTFNFFGELEEGTVRYCSTGFHPDEYFTMIGKALSTMAVAIDCTKSICDSAEDILNLPAPGA